MSPEQVQSAADVDIRTDLWSLGVVLYELVSGIPPFEGKSHMDVLGKVLREDPPSLVATCPHVPPGLEQVIRTCLQRKREMRYSDAGELASALVPFGTESARISHRSIMGLFLGTDSVVEFGQAVVPDSSTPPKRPRIPVLNEELVRAKWKDVGTASLELEVDRALSVAELRTAPSIEADSDEALTTVMRPNRGAGAVRENPTKMETPSAIAAQPSAYEPDGRDQQRAAPPMGKAHPSAGAISTTRITPAAGLPGAARIGHVSSVPPRNDKKPAQSSLLEAMAGPLPSLSSKNTSSSGKRSWILVRRRPRGKRGPAEGTWTRGVQTGYKMARRRFVILGLCAMAALAVAGAMLARRISSGRRGAQETALPK
jgi:serine/threonine protein kinase